MTWRVWIMLTLHKIDMLTIEANACFVLAFMMEFLFRCWHFTCFNEPCVAICEDLFWADRIIWPAIQKHHSRPKPACLCLLDVFPESFLSLFYSPFARAFRRTKIVVFLFARPYIHDLHAIRARGFFAVSFRHSEHYNTFAEVL